MEDIIFEGSFDLTRALREFDDFVKKVNTRLGNLNKVTKTSSTDTDKVTKKQKELNAEYAEQARLIQKLEKEGQKYVNQTLKRIDQAVAKGVVSEERANAARNQAVNKLNQLRNSFRNVEIAVEHNEKATNGNIISLKRLENRYSQLEDNLEQVERNLAKTSLRFQEQNRLSDKFFKGLVVGGFALQQFGGAMNLYVTQPLIRAGKAITETLLKFDDFEETLRVIGGRSEKEIRKTFDVIREVARQPNIELEQTLELFTKVTEARRGAISDKEFRTIGLGLSRALGSLESTERRGFFGQLIDILSGGEASNIDKTLAGVARLKVAYNEAAAALGDAATQQEILLAALQKLADEPVIDGLRNKLKNLEDTVTLLGKRIGDIYKKDLEDFVSFIDKRVIPAVDKFLTRLENDKGLQRLLLILTGIAAVLPPILFTLGTFSVVFAGINSLLKGITGGIGLLSKPGLEIKALTESLGVISAEIGGQQGLVAQLIGSLPRLTALITPITAALTALAAVVIYVYTQSEDFRASVARLGDYLSRSLINTLYDLKAILDTVSTALGGLIALLTDAGVIETLGIIFSLLTDLGTILLSIANSPLRIVLSFLANIQYLFTEGLIPAIYRFQIAILEVLPEFVRQFFGIDEVIKSLKQKLADMGISLDKNTQSMADLSDETGRGVDENQKYAKLLTKMSEILQEQNKQIDENIKKLRERRIELANQARDIISNASKGRYSDIISGVDFTDPASVASGRGAIEDLGIIGITQAAQKDIDERNKARREIIDRYAQYFDDLIKTVDEPKVRQAIVKFKATLLTKLALDVKDVNEFYKGIATNAATANAARLFVARLQEELNTAYGGSNALLESQADTDKQRSDFEKQVREAQTDLENQKQILEFKRQIEAQKRLLELRDAEADRLQKEFEQGGSLNQYLEGIFNNENERLKIQLRISFLENQIQAVGEERLGYRKLIQQQINQEGELIKKEAEDRTKLLQKKVIQDLIDAEEKINDQTVRLLRQRRDGLLQQIQLQIELARLGGKTATGQNVPQLLKQLGEPYTEDQFKLFKEISRSRNNVLEALKNAPTANAQNLRGAIGNLGFTNDLKEQIKAIQSLLVSLHSLDYSVGLSDKERASVLAFTQELQIYLERLVDIEKERAEVKELLIEKTEELKIAEKEYQLNSLERERELLDLSRQILAERRKRGDFRGFFGVFGDLFGRVTKQNEEERELLQLEARILQAELDVALGRLEIEKEIAIVRAEGNEALQKKIREQYEKEIEHIKDKYKLEKILIDEQIANIGLGSSISDVLIGTISQALKKIFGKKQEGEPIEVEHEVSHSGAVITEGQAEETEKSVNKQTTSLGKLGGALGKIVKTLDLVGAAFLEMETITTASVARAVKAALDALAQEALVNAIKYAAIALSALVFLDFATAAKAAKASAAWTAAYVAAKAAGSVVGLLDNSDKQITNSADNRANQVSDDEETKSRLVRQKAYQLLIMFDIRQDEGVLVKKHIQSLNSNAPVTTLVLNTQQGFAFPPLP